MGKKKKIIILVASILLIAIIAVCITAWIIWQNEKDEGEKSNQRYGLKTSARHVTSTGMTVTITCSGEKKSRDLFLDYEPCLVERETNFGWKPIKAMSNSVHDDERRCPIGAEATFEMGIYWGQRYGELSAGTYRVGVPIYKNHNQGQRRVGWCYVTIEVLEGDELKERQKTEWAEDNYDNWQSIYDMTKVIEENFLEMEYQHFDTIPHWYKDYDATALDIIEPNVSEGFMTNYYNALFYQLTWENGVPAECWEEGQQVFLNMNKELHEISAYVLNEIEGGKEIEDLTSKASELHADVQGKLSEFCKTHTNNIEDFLVVLEQKKSEIKGVGECSTWNIELTIENVTPTGATLILKRDNAKEGAEPLVMTGWYDILVKKGALWDHVIRINVENVMTEEDRSVQPQETIQWEFDWESVYGVLPKGTYRFRKNVQVEGDFEHGPEQGDYKVYYAEFEIE